MTSMVLRSESGDLSLSLDESGDAGWYQVHLNAAGMQTALGAQGLHYIAAQLLLFLSDPAELSRWVFSLSERHTSAFGEHVAGKTILHLHDANANRFAKLELTPTEQRQWIQDLLRQSGV